MRFDDRLLTVLNQPAGDRHDAAVRWRQLVDLVARAGSNSDSPTVATALKSIRADAGMVDETARAAAARAVAALPLPLSLLEYFVSDSLQVSAPVLAAATLEPAQWQAMLAVADDETRRFIETLHPELSAAPSPDLTETLVEPPAKAAPASRRAGPSLSDVVARIERRRRSRMAPQGRGALPAAPGGAPSLFRWECGPSGEISWVEGAPRGPLIGRSLARSQDVLGGGVDQDVSRAFALRAPFREGTLLLEGDGLLSGEWRISGVPAFEPSDGRFAGYRGIALREEPAISDGPTMAPSELLADPDSLRELVHEIKTPLNAIIGFAEIIDGQYLGPADHRYRERAGEIVGQARLLLAAIDDLDFAAKVQSAGRRGQPRMKLGPLIERITPELRERANEKGIVFEVPRPGTDLTISVDAEVAERLLVRMCGAVIDRAEGGERLRLSADRIGDQCRVSITRPKTLKGIDEEELFAAGDGTIAGAFFLRLVRGLARVAGADLTASASAIALIFPRA